MGPHVLQQETDNISRKGFDLKTLGELGYRAREIARLRALGVI